MEQLGDRIRRHREVLGITQQELGRLAGITGQAVSNYENGRGGVPKWSTIESLARVFKIAPTAMVEGVGMPLPTHRDRGVHSSNVRTRSADVTREAKNAHAVGARKGAAHG